MCFPAKTAAVFRSQQTLSLLLSQNPSIVFPSPPGTGPRADTPCRWAAGNTAAFLVRRAVPPLQALRLWGSLGLGSLACGRPPDKGGCRPRLFATPCERNSRKWHVAASRGQTADNRFRELCSLTLGGSDQAGWHPSPFVFSGRRTVDFWRKRSSRAICACQERFGIHDFVFTLLFPLQNSDRKYL